MHITIQNVLSVLLSAHALAIAIVNLTPTPKDDQIVGQVYNWIETLAGIVTPLAKDEPNPPTK